MRQVRIPALLSALILVLAFVTFGCAGPAATSTPTPEEDAGHVAEEAADHDEGEEAHEDDAHEEVILTGAALRGEEVFNTVGCGACHGQDAEGTTIAPALSGHTEKLAEACGVKRVTMAFVGGGMRLALVSTHLGLLEFCHQFNLGRVFQTLEHFHTALVNWFGIEHPRIAVAGLNPHAGEDGRFGDEEKRVIEPAMQMARHSGIDLSGPFAADTLFTPRSRSRFDGIVAMYHDQGLIPLKMLAFDTAVNLTLGLPLIR
ncbi:MAG: 4-hydroxythreonine-4-phosphate dehydrogenase PdxA, partial [Chloroflexi bacterium]|nr:4-hydroxythreonine-4-phosphate dehydrogenase PdxA [Chloroflexota bacterium]